MNISSLSVVSEVILFIVLHYYTTYRDGNKWRIPIHLQNKLKEKVDSWILQKYSEMHVIFPEILIFMSFSRTTSLFTI